MDEINFHIIEDDTKSWYDVKSSFRVGAPPGGWHVCSCCTKNMAETIVEALETLCRVREISPAEFRKNWRTW
jgi:hypothetical protein